MMLTVMLNLDGGDPHLDDGTSHGANWCPTFLKILGTFCACVFVFRLSRTSFSDDRDGRLRLRRSDRQWWYSMVW